MKKSDVKFWNLLKVIWQYFFNENNDTKKKSFGSNRSIVRKIGSILPLPPAHRVILKPLKKDCINMKTLTEVLSENYSDDGIGSISDSDTCESETNCAHVDEICQLQQELKQLRAQVKEILENQKIFHNFQAEKENRALGGPPLPPPPPPPLPPPPPPLLPNLLVTATPTKIGARKSLPRYKQNTAVDALSDVIKELANERPKLKPVQRSPGGRPMRPKKDVRDPSDILTEVLKKRFSAIQLSDANESDNSASTDIVSP